ncbi:hypothetical protein A6P39_044055 (plasmid) [Streptomyces sp. FXJ1.172]|uniref:hypothetical protein n=1 Tax=Streptomyces sp. FXJ1.172 TaxID=710705 RepID=UPI0023DD653C|nr:hypothetical protein [Streptomyces sp. FXJ1.172]WEP00690.1 hypothetical protein A6P39_044055 [Streptomyces sp. FXJ1.172]
MLLAAAVHALAADAGVGGAQIASLPLAASAGQDSLLTTLDTHPLSALQACPADELGGGEREQLLAAYGTTQWSAVQAAARTVVEHHVQDAAGHGCPYPSVSDRAFAMAAARREQLLDDLDAVAVEPW